MVETTALLLFALAVNGSDRTPSCAVDAIPPAASRSGAHDFDFEFGRWRVHHRVKRAGASGQWDEYDGTSEVRPLLGGAGNVEDNVFLRPSGTTRGVAMRAYDPTSAIWAIWWIDSRDPHATLDPPVKGRFVNGVGLFYSLGPVAGVETCTRFKWTVVAAGAARWEQAYSTDGGRTWDTNWIMDFRRDG
jgi:hypothetical protein